MAIPQHETLESMGLAYVPFTFPTVAVRNNMSVALVRASNAEVDNLWQAYHEGTVKSALAPYGGPGVGGKGNADILNFIANKTNLGKDKAAAFLNGLWKAVTEQGAARKYLDPAGYKASQEGTYSLNPIESIKTAAGDLGQAAKNLLTPVADPVTNIVKYAAVGLVAAAVIYGIYHGTKVFKGARRRRKGKG
jgi:hypothetical protein